MAFATQETSIESGRPLYLIRFGKDAKEWMYNNTDHPITFAGKEYKPTPVSVTSFIYTGDAKSEGLDITMPSNTALCQYLDAGAATSLINVSIRKLHITDTSATGNIVIPIADADAPVVWVGEMIALSRPSVNSRLLRCNTLSLSMRRTGLRLSWGRSCPHMLYDVSCKVNKTAFRVPLISTSVINGITVSSSTLNSYAAGYFAGGFIEWVVDGIMTERRGIETHNGTNATIIGGTAGMSGLGATNFAAYPGCPRTIAVCNSKFGNSLNFGGIRYLQGENPFDGSPVY